MAKNASDEASRIHAFRKRRIRDGLYNARSTRTQLPSVPMKGKLCIRTEAIFEEHFGASHAELVMVRPRRQSIRLESKGIGNLNYTPTLRLRENDARGDVPHAVLHRSILEIRAR